MEINFLKKQGNFTKFEFWGFVLLFAFGLFIFITNKFEEDGMIANEPFRSYFEASNTPYSFYRNFFIPQIVQLSVLFFAFVFLNFMVIPGFAQRRSLVKSVIVLVVVFLVTVAIVFICNTYLQAYLYTSDTQAKANGEIIRVSLENTLQVFMMLIVYTLIKYTGLYLLSIADFIHKKIKYVTKEAIVAAFIWLILQLLLIAGRADTELILGWVIIIPYGIIFYSYAFHTLIPQMLTKERAFVAYLLQSAFIIAVCFLPVFLIVLAASRYEARTFSISFLNTVIQLFITVPLTWLLYNRQQKGNEEMNFLKKELKQSTANIDFLRSQINPHFLFNAMNTLYGTAIQENAERTSEGIQKLADMMRFMLQENVQEKIVLSRRAT